MLPALADLSIQSHDKAAARFCFPHLIMMPGKHFITFQA